MQNNENIDEWLNWIEEAINKKHIKYYEFENFKNIQEIGSGISGKVFRANWKSFDHYLALKSFFNLNKITLKEIINELELQRVVDFHNNIIRFYGITKHESENIFNPTKDYLLVMEYADSGTLRYYLKNNFHRLTWDNKYNLASQLACSVRCLHEEGIVHRDLHSCNVLVHQDSIKLADFGLSKRIDEASESQSKLLGMVPYIDPKVLMDNNLRSNEKSDIYSIGVLLWEISSGKPPFREEKYDFSLMYKISQGRRETTVPNTPNDYSSLYSECWNNEPSERPTIHEIVNRLKVFISYSTIYQQNDISDQPNPIPDTPNSIGNSLHRELSQTIQDFTNINTNEMDNITSINKQINENFPSEKNLAISKKHIKSYDYKYFSNIQEIGTGGFGKVSRAMYKNSEQYLALKSFINLDNTTLEELSRELALHRDVDFHDNVIKFYGVTNLDRDSTSDKMMLVMEYADSGSLRSYLGTNFNNLTWYDRYSLAYQLACAVSCLHDEGIVHRDLHSGNILIHQNKVKLSDFGLFKRIEASSKKKSSLFGIIPYIDPKKFDMNIEYSLNVKSDVYSIGVLLWEISSGQIPFKDVIYDVYLATKIFQGQREQTIDGTADEYTRLYKECWNDEPDDRPIIIDVVKRLKLIISRSDTTIKNKNFLIPNNNNIDYYYMSINNSSRKNTSQLIRDLEKIKKVEQNVNTLTKVDEKLIDEIVNLIFKEIDEEKDQETRKKHILNNLNDEIALPEIYDWLSINQNEPNFIFLLGYFNYHGIVTGENKKEAFNLFKIASEKDHILAYYYVGLCFEFGNGTVRNEELAFEYFKKIANKNHASGQFKVGYFYYKGIIAKKNLKEAFNWYEKAAYNGNLIAMCNLGLMYRNGEGTNKDLDKAIYWYNESAEKGNQDSQKSLEKLKKIKDRKKTWSRAWSLGPWSRNTT